MPTINRLKKKKTTDNPQYKKRQKVYQTTLWQKLRTAHLLKHPLCYICEKEGRTTLAQHCHHVRSFTSGMNDNEINALAFDASNLLSVCAKCHNELHHGRFKGCDSVEQIEQYIEAQKKTK